MEPDQESAVPPRSRLLQSKPRVSGWALSAWLTSVVCVPLVPIILGIVALQKIKNSGGRLSGSGLAVMGLALGLFEIVIAWFTVPVMVESKKTSARAVAVQNLRQIGFILLDFETEYGSFPSRQIYRDNADKFKNATGGDSANDLLGLLLAGGIVDNEEIFYAKGGSRFDKKPDNVFDNPEKLLEPGECGFGYVMLEGDVPLSTAMPNGACPVVVAPLMPGSGGADTEFNHRPYDGVAVYLRLDLAVKSGRINEFGKVRLPENRHTLFETGPDTVWGDKMPDVRPPE